MASTRGGTKPREARVVVVGNPNAGKTTIFNRLTGLSQKVGNYPGVTVEKKVGRRTIGGFSVSFVDLPGTYSLAAHSPDEMVAVDVLLGHEPGEPAPDLVLQVVDASNLERNLYLLSQVLDLGVPVVVALNMVDAAAARGVKVDARTLAQRLGVPVVPVAGHRGTGIDALFAAIESALAATPTGGEASWKAGGGAGCVRFSGALHGEVGALHGDIAPAFESARGRSLHPFEVLRAVIDRGGHAEKRIVDTLGDASLAKLESARKRVAGAAPLPALEASVRYAWVRERIAGTVARGRLDGPTWTERIDRILTHKVLGLALFGLAMLLVFESIFAWAQPAMDALDGLFKAASREVAAMLPAGAFQSLLSDGVIAGAGMVVVFLPQILILFLFIGLLEDCGYMARAAFLMDRVMQKCGLSGKSFIPMLSGFACAVPGILATRVIEDRRDRIATILVTPLMSCSARLPVYTIFIGTFIPEVSVVRWLGLQGLTLFALYVLGIATAVAMAWVFRSTLLKGAKPPFVLELPSYKWPSPRNVLIRLFDRAKAFLFRAGTTILAIAVVVWGLAYFPRPAQIAERFSEERARVEREVGDPALRDAPLAEIDRREAGEYLRQSYFGRAGRAVEPAFRPLGWDWRISMAVLASFPAREVLVATLGTIYNLGSEQDASSDALRRSLRAARWSEGSGALAGKPVYNVPVALSIMVFFALCCQCGATVATIRRETNSWGWAWFAFGYMTVLAYAGAFATYQIGKLVGGVS